MADWWDQYPDDDGGEQAPTNETPSQAEESNLPDQQAAPQKNWWDDYPNDRQDDQSGDQAPYGPSQDPPSTAGSAIRGAIRSAIPSTAGLLAGGAAAAVATPVTSPIGGLAAGLGVGIGTQTAVSSIQDEIADQLGLDSPESRAADSKAHPYATAVGELVPALATFNISGAGKAATSMAQRLLQGGIMGGTDLVGQAISKGPSNIDYGQAAISTAGGLALGKPRKWAEGIIGPDEATPGIPDSTEVPPATEQDQTHWRPGVQNPDPAVRAEQAQMTTHQAIAAPSPGTSGNPVGPAGKASVEGVNYLKADDTAAAEGGEGTWGSSAPVQLDAAKPIAADVASAMTPEQAQSGEGTWGTEQPVEGLPDQQQPAPQPAPPPEPNVGTSAQVPTNIQSMPTQPPLEPNAQPLAPNDFMRRAEVQNEVPGETEGAPGELQKPNWWDAYPDDNKPPPKPTAYEAAHPEGPVFPTDKMALPKESAPATEPKVTVNAEGLRTAPEKPEGMELPPNVHTVKFPDGTSFTQHSAINYTHALIGRMTDQPGAKNPNAPWQVMGFSRSRDGLRQKFNRTDWHTDKQIVPIEPETDVRGAPEPAAQLEFGAKEGAEPHSLSAAATPGQKASFVGRLRDAYNNLVTHPAFAEHPIRMIFSPQTISEPANQTSIIYRKNLGMQKQLDARATQALEGKTYEFARAANGASKDDTNNFWENYQRGTVDKNNPLQTLLDPLRSASTYYDDQLKQFPHMDQKNFDLNYAGHSGLWADPEKYREFVDDFMSKQTQTKTTVLKNGKIKTEQVPHKNPITPTISDALDAGVKVNPDLLRPDGGIDLPRAVAADFKQKADYIASQNTLTQMVDVDHLAYVKHDGMPTDSVQLKNRTFKGLDVYADPHSALVFNNAYSPGMHATPGLGRLFDIVQHGKNAMTAVQLFLGGFHTLFATLDTMNSNMAVGMHEVFSGDIAGGLKTMAKTPGAPVKYWRDATAALNEYKTPGTDANAITQEAVEHLRNANAGFGRLAGETPEYNITGNPAGSFFKSFQRGRLKMETDKYQQDIKDAFSNNMLKGVSKTAGTAFDVAGRAMQTMMDPLFDHYIPRMKVGAMMHQMSSFLEHNPTASYEQKAKAARKISDSIDNRLGELVQSNIFWNRTLKQGAQVSMLSWSFNMGDVRELAGGALSMLRNPAALSYHNADFDPRLGYVIAFPMMAAVTNGIYQYLKTGELPKEPMDLLAPRTGGKALHSNKPERAVVPGYEKDVLGYYADPTHEMYNKLSAPLHLAMETLTNRDWKDQPIWNPNDPMIKKMQEYFGHVGQSLMPITAGTVGHTRKGTGISKVERGFGIRNAPAWLEKPESTKTAIQKKNDRAWKEKLNTEKRLNE